MCTFQLLLGAMTAWQSVQMEVPNVDAVAGQSKAAGQSRRSWALSGNRTSIYLVIEGSR